MQSATCPAHPDTPVEPLFEANDRFWGFEGTFRYGRCPICGSWVLDPCPTSEEMGRFYGGYYSEAELSRERALFAGALPHPLKTTDGLRALGFLSDLRRRKATPGPDAQLLDVGCGLGHFLRFTHALTGVAVRGVDFDRRCCEFADDVHGIPVDVGELRAQKYDDGRFDYVTTWHCLEHVYDPQGELCEIARVTRPGGWLHLEVPTPGVLAALFRGRWVFLQPPTHLYHLRPATLICLLERAGFEILRLSRPWAPTELAGSLLLRLGVHGLVPRVISPGTGLRGALWKLLFWALMVLDIPLTGLVGSLRSSGLIRIVARRRSGAPSRAQSSSSAMRMSA